MQKNQIYVATAILKASRTCTVNNSVRLLSTSSPREEVVNKKTVYKQQLSELRKKWTDDHQARIEVEIARRKEERRAIVVQKAVRLRERNVVSAQNIVKDRELKAAAMARYREHVIKNNLVAEKKMEATTEQYEKLIADLMEEQKCWITTPEKVDSMINDALFKDDKPSTTGIQTNSSEYWRHMCVPFNLDVLFNASFQDRYGPSDASPESRYLEAMSAKRLQVREMIESMIGNGHDRQHFNEIVDKYVELYTDNDALLESSDFLDEEEVCFLCLCLRLCMLHIYVRYLHLYACMCSSFRNSLPRCKMNLVWMGKMRRNYFNSSNKKFPRLQVGLMSREAWMTMRMVWRRKLILLLMIVMLLSYALPLVVRRTIIPLNISRYLSRYRYLYLDAAPRIPIGSPRAMRILMISKDLVLI